MEPRPTLEPGVRLNLLGGGGLEVRGRSELRLERKTLGLLAYLALEGPTPRSRLAGLLWPEVEEERARANLRQCLHRLKNAVGMELVLSDEPLRLVSGIEVDAADLEARAFTGDYAALLSLEGRLLDPHDYDDCPELAEWVELARERIASLQREALLSETERHHSSGDYAAALPWAERLLIHDPLSEEAYRRVMRLKYLQGDRSGALRTYQRCQEVLSKELGIEPLPETRQLAHLIDQGQQLLQGAPVQKAQIPLSVLRPPLLVGREPEWLRMEQAWEGGLSLALQGEPGVGKSRLMLDFVASKGAYQLLSGRPGDEGVPYAAFARGYRQMMQQHPDLSLKDWQRQELSRLVPGLVAEAAAPLNSETDKLRFLEALAHLIEERMAQGLQTLVLDDVQFIDPASFEAAQYMAAKFAGRLRLVLGYRTGELPDPLQASLRRSQGAGQMLLIEVGPLSALSVSQLVQALQVPGLGELGERLERYTGGNPMFVLETIKNLIETDQVQQWPKRLPPSGKIGSLIARRLERLSPAGLRVARLAAVAGVDFGLELAAKVLETGALDLAEPWSELEAAQVLKGTTFAHDLIYEATLQTIPLTIKTFLHQHIAEYLQGLKADPARIAGHWLEAEPSRAIPLLQQAAKAAEAAYQLTLAADLYERAVQISEGLGQTGQTFELLEALSEVMCRFDTGSRHEQLIQRMLALAHHPEQQARTWLREAIRLGEHAFGPEAEQAARKGLDHVADHPELRIRLLDALAQSLFVQRKTPALMEALEQLRQIYLERQDPLQAAICTSRMGVALDQLERHREALGYYGQAQPVLDQSPDRLMRSGFYHNWSVCLAALGYGEAALQAQLRVQSLLEGMQGAVGREVHHLNNLALRYYDLENYAQARQALERVLEIAPAEWGWTTAFSHYQMARLHWVWGDLPSAWEWLGRALEVPKLPLRDESTYRILQLLLCWKQGQDPAPVLERLEVLFAGTRGLAYGRFLLVKARISNPTQALPHLQAALALAQEKDWPALGIAAHTLWAKGLLETAPMEALEHTQAAMHHMSEYRPSGCSKLEVLWVHYLAHARAAQPGHPKLLEAVVKHLQEIANHKIPPEYQQSFLTQNPISRAVLEEGRGAGGQGSRGEKE